MLRFQWHGPILAGHCPMSSRQLFAALLLWLAIVITLHLVLLHSLENLYSEHVLVGCIPRYVRINKIKTSLEDVMQDFRQDGYQQVQLQNMVSFVAQVSSRVIQLIVGSIFISTNKLPFHLKLQLLTWNFSYNFRHIGWNTFLVCPSILITMTCCKTKICSLDSERKGKPQIQTGDLWHWGKCSNTIWPNL